MPDNKELNIYYNIIDSEEVADIFIFGDITSWCWMDSDVSSYRLANKIAEIPENKSVRVHVNSLGGELAEGLAIYNVLKSRKNVTTINEGFSCSAASIIFMAGSKRIMKPASLLFIHNAISYQRGNSEDFKKAAEDLEKMNGVIRTSYISSGVTLSEDELKELMNKEEWITAEYALENGFSTETAEENNTTNNIISTFLNKINTPSSKKEETTDEIAERLADLVVERFKDIMQEGKNSPTDDIETVNTVKNRKEETIKTGFLGFNKTKED